MTCSRCASHGQVWVGDPPRCAFPRGVFDSDNWNCATMSELRSRAEEGVRAYSEDQNAALLPWDGNFIVLSWYKQRGTTDTATIVDPPYVRTLTLAMAEQYLEECR